MNTWQESRPSRWGTHHITKNGSLYENRFEAVLSFHEPGLAPVCLDGKWYHITPDGKPAYKHVYDEAFGYYNRRAAVRLNEDWFHIHPDGQRLYDTTYSWCGNYQNELCTVRDWKAQYFHINLDGDCAYDEKYLYAGDYREGYAVVKNNQGCTHIDAVGHLLHEVYFEDLGVYHKGYATAKDTFGWCHIDKTGIPLYSQRYKLVEPFYNGYAYCEKLDGTKIRIKPNGEIKEIISDQTRNDELKLLLIGNISSGKTTIGRKIQSRLGYDFVEIDECRRQLGDDTVSGEYRAWNYFISRCEESRGTILEFSGGGPHAHNIAKALENSNLKTHILWLDLPAQLCLKDSLQRNFDSPYLYKLGDLGELIDHIAIQIESNWEKIWRPRFLSHRIKNPRNVKIENILTLLERENES